MEFPADASPVSISHRLFAGGGAAGQALAAIDWASSALGAVDSWPQTLRTSIRICLASRHAMIIWWGPDLTFFYNDAYAPTLGKRAPWAMARPGREVWPEIWPIIGPMLHGVLETGTPTWSDDELLFLERHGYSEETYHTFSYSPIEDETGKVVGVFTAVTETTARVLNARRGRAARELASAIVDARSSEDVCARAASVLDSIQADIPFALIYEVRAQSQTALLREATGIARGSMLSPERIDLTSPGAPWQLGHVVATGSEALVEHTEWGDVSFTVDPAFIPQQALVLPVTEPGQSAPTAILVAGISPHRALDADYRHFCAQLASHLATAFAAAHAYEAERQRAEALAEIDRAKTAFFSNVSHEFRTPLTLMLGPVNDIIEAGDAISPEVRHQLELVRRNGLRLSKLVNTLLDFSRIEAGRAQAVYMPTDLATFTADLASSFRSLVEQAGMELIVECPPLPEPVYVDRDMWEKIVLNLLSNAFKFTFEGRISITLRPQNGAAELEVQDSGVGIRPDELPRLFERFHRIEGMPARTHEGSGIGLALVQELVHLHGGTITVSSTPGSGTTFVVSVPFGTAHLPADRINTRSSLTSTAVGASVFIEEAERWLPAEAIGDKGTDSSASLVSPAGLTDIRAILSGTQGARLLIADDNADMRDYLTRLLSEHYQVKTVANGRQALAAIEREVPDLLLLDVMMPELDGFGVLAQLRMEPRTRHLPVIVLSARAGQEAMLDGLTHGADDYVIKPFAARDVLSRIAARLEISRTRQQAEARTQRALHGLLALARLIAGDDSMGKDDPQIYSALVALARDVFECEITSLVSFDNTTRRMIPLSTVGRHPEQEMEWYTTIHRHTFDEIYSANEITRLRDGKTLVKHMGDVTADGVPSLGVRSTLSAPLSTGDMLYGVLSFAFKTAGHVYTTVERELASGFARMAMLVLERSRLLVERAQTQADMLALRETTRRMDEFLGIASHELRTPLTSVMANVQMGQRAAHDLTQAQLPEGPAARAARLHALLQRTDRQIRRLDRLVGDLLDVSRITAGKLELRSEHCDLLEIVRETVEAQRAAAAPRRILLEQPPIARLALFADADRIGQAITNYLSNALKYSAPDQPVHVSISASPEHARVEVRDHGPGLSHEQQAQLFERFYRVPGIDQMGGSGVGLGLGLYICRTIIERHGGQFGVQSTPGAGSTFWFTIPRIRV